MRRRLGADTFVKLFLLQAPEECSPIVMVICIGSAATARGLAGLPAYGFFFDLISFNVYGSPRLYEL